MNTLVSGFVTGGVTSLSLGAAGALPRCCLQSWGEKCACCVELHSCPCFFTFSVFRKGWFEAHFCFLTFLRDQMFRTDEAESVTHSPVSDKGRKCCRGISGSSKVQ